MCEHFLECLQGGISRFKGSTEVIKKNIILSTTILMLVMGVFFCAFSGKYALAGSFEVEKIQVEFKPDMAGIMGNPDSGLGLSDFDDYCKNDNSENSIENEEGDRQEVMEIIYPISDIIIEKLGIIGKLGGVVKDKDPEKLCDNKEKGNDVDIARTQKENKIFEMVADYPIEEMIPFISGRSDDVAYYLVAIAKKESNWGKRSPQKNGGTCYNYWGYRGSYNRTESGYSCFDSPEQAVEQVGNRIENLVDRNIDTPEEMVVWKCGSTCAGHDPQGVLKWISDVKLCYKKLSV